MEFVGKIVTELKNITDDSVRNVFVDIGKDVAYIMSENNSRNVTVKVNLAETDPDKWQYEVTCDVN